MVRIFGCTILVAAALTAAGCSAKTTFACHTDDDCLHRVGSGVCKGVSDAGGAGVCVVGGGGGDDLGNDLRTDDADVEILDLTGADLSGVTQCTVPDSGPHAVGACPSEAPVCGIQALCRGCAAGSECDSGVCRTDGTCGSSIAIVHVDGATCKPTGADGSSNKPYCEIDAALAALGGRSIISVAGSTSAYKPIIISSAVEIYGPDRGSSVEAIVTGGEAHAVSVTASSGSVVLSGLRLSGAGVGKDNLHCNDAGNQVGLVLRDLLIVDGQGWGIATVGCAIDAARLRILANATGGISAVDRSIAVENSIVANNHGPAFLLNTAGTTTLRFLTVVANLVMEPATQAGAVHNIKTDPRVTISASILWNNSLLGGTPLYGTDGADLAANAGVAGTVSTTPPDFLHDATDFHLKGGTSNNLACCIDKLGAGPATDLDGRRRPQGTKYDIGAHEVPQ